MRRAGIQGVKNHMTTHGALLRAISSNPSERTFQLADGKQRDAATYRAWGTVSIGPQFVMSREWKGELPA